MTHLQRVGMRGDCHICGRMIAGPDESVRFPCCECHLEIERLRSEAKLWREAHGRQTAQRFDEMVAERDALAKRLGQIIERSADMREGEAP